MHVSDASACYLVSGRCGTHDYFSGVANPSFGKADSTRSSRNLSPPLDRSDELGTIAKIWGTVSARAMEIAANNDDGSILRGILVQLPGNPLMAYARVPERKRSRFRVQPDRQNDELLGTIEVRHTQLHESENFPVLDD